ncbi:MAG: hypothetical protein AAF085_07070, partial [Planctomycetota bacterium]
KQPQDESAPAFGQGIMVGEVTDTTAIVQVRVTQGTKLINGDFFDDDDTMRDGDLPGKGSLVRFFIGSADGLDWEQKMAGGVLNANKDNDFIVRVVFDKLEPGKQYNVWCEVPETDKAFLNELDKTSDTYATFKTHPGKDTSAPVRFTLTSCMNYDKFIGNDLRGIRSGKAYEGEDRHLATPPQNLFASWSPIL